MNKWLMIGIVTLGFLTGCGESIEHRVQRAQIALASSKLNTAVELADSVLKEKPGYVDALLVKAQAEQRLLHMDAAKATLDQLLKEHSDNAKARRLLVGWAFSRMNNLMEQSGFANDSQVQQTFDATLDIGRAQADWFGTHDNGLVESQYYQARLALIDGARLRALAAVRRQSLETVNIAGEKNDAALALVKQLDFQIEQRTLEAQDLFCKVLDADPRHFEAAELYTSLLVTKRNWPDLWILAQKLAKQKDLPPQLVNQLVLALLTMPPAVQPVDKSLELARQLQADVEPARRNNIPWKLTEARLAIRSNEVPRAIPLLESVLKDDPRNPIGRFLLAQCYYGQKEFAKAKDIVQTLATEVASPEVQTLYGLTLMETGDVTMAREALRKAIDMNPDDPAPRRAFLALQAKSGNIEQAQGDVDAFYEKNPADPRAIRFKMQFEQIRNQRPVIAGLLERVAKLQPLTDEHLAILVDGYMYLQQFDKAQQYAQQLVNRRPDALENHLRLAQAMLMQNQDEQVKQMLIGLRQKFPNAASVDQMLSELYLQRQSYDKAIEIAQAIVDREPNNDAVRMILIRGLSGLTLFDEALDNLNHILEKNPHDAQAHAMAARIYQVMGQMDKANEHLAQIDPLNVDERTSPALLAQLKVRAKQYDDAADICNRALASGNTDPTLRQILASVYLQKNDISLAETNLLALVRMQPNNAQTYALLTRFYQEQKIADKGLMELNNFLNLNEPLTRIAQANLLASLGRIADALDRMQPIYEPLIRQRDRRALMVADMLARLHLAKKDLTGAVAVYEPLIAARLTFTEATLRQIDLTQGMDTTEGTLEKLNNLAKQLTPDDRRIRLELIRRYRQLKQYDRALALTEEWIALQPDQSALQQFKAELLADSGQPARAVQVLQTIIKKTPEDQMAYQQLARVYLALHDYPSVEATYVQMTKIDTGARITALADLGLLYVGLGLNQQAAVAFDNLEKEGRLHDPRVMLAMGRALAAIGKTEQARQRLLDVPEYATQYPAAQVALARLEQALGMVEPARKRLEQLASDPNQVALASAELLSLNFRNKQFEDLLRWSDQKLAIETLPETLRRAWLGLRVSLSDLKHDLPGLVVSLDALAQRYPNSLQVTAARVVALAGAHKTEEALQLYRTTPALIVSRWGPLLAAMLGEPANMSADYPGLETYIVALATGDVVRARAAIDNLGPQKTVFAADLRMILDRSDVTSPDMQQLFRELAGAQVAVQTNLSQTCIDLCQDVVNRVPSITPAYAMMFQALLDSEQSVDVVAQRVQKTIPNTAIAFLAGARIKANAKDYAGAAEELNQLQQREPNNDQVRYTYSQMLAQAGQNDQAITILEALYAKPGPVQGAAANDLAYLLAENQPKRIEEAFKIAQSAYESSHNSPPLLDTMGWIEHLRGNNVKAVEYLSQAVASLSNTPDVHYHLGLAYAGVDNKTWAKYHLQEVASKTDNPLSVQAGKALRELGQ